MKNKKRNLYCGIEAVSFDSNAQSIFQSNLETLTQFKYQIIIQC